MLEFGGSAAPAAADDIIRDGSDATFMQDVIEASGEAAVIVDFHAEWCGPCKTLGPALEAAVKGAGGAARLVKIDVDQNPAVAGQLRVQSLPTVYAFVDGRPVDAFQGALTASEVKAFVDKAAAMGAGGGDAGGLDEALDAADQMLDEGAIADAMQTFAAVLGEDKGNLRAIGGFARAYVAGGDLDRARAVLAEAPDDKADEPFIAAARAAIELAEATADTGEATELRARLDANPDDHQTRLDLALALIGARDNEGAIDALLELFRRDREWGEGAAKAQLMTLFESLGPNDPLVLKGRRRLSSMIFA